MNADRSPDSVFNKLVIKHYVRDDFEKFLKGVKFRKVKKVPQKTVCFITFDVSTTLILDYS